MTSPGLGARPTVIDCVTAVRRLWDYLDGRLSAIAHDEMDQAVGLPELHVAGRRATVA